jgi:putative PIG3 family NAD(P)H quinone oxidoreductase
MNETLPAIMPIPATMTAIEISQPGAAEVLKPAERPTPSPADDEILIRVEAAGINRPDLLQRQGNYPPPPGASDIPGLEVAGTVAALGAGVIGWAVGDPVCALLAGGGYAQYAAVPSVQCLPLPTGLSMVEAAALPETLFTCWTNLVDGGHLSAGQTVLIHGGSSGIGTTAIQLAKILGARVLTTAGSPEKCAACVRLGADLAIDYRAEDFVKAVKDATDGRGVDVVLDMVGGDYVRRNIEVMAQGGHHVSIASLGGAEATIPIFRVMQKRLILTGSTLRARSPAEKGRIAKAVHEGVWPAIADGRLKPLIHATFPMDRAADAHRALEAGDHIGKIVLTMDDG